MTGIAWTSEGDGGEGGGHDALVSYATTTTTTSGDTVTTPPPGRRGSDVLNWRRAGAGGLDQSIEHWGPIPPPKHEGEVVSLSLDLRIFQIPEMGIPRGEGGWE